jgi:hypothetical protein
MIDGKLFRLYPINDQKSTLSQGIVHQRFIYGLKVTEDRSFPKLRNKALSMTAEEFRCDQQFSRFITGASAFLESVASQLLRNRSLQLDAGMPTVL